MMTQLLWLFGLKLSFLGISSTRKRLWPLWISWFCSNHEISNLSLAALLHLVILLIEISHSLTDPGTGFWIFPGFFVRILGGTNINTSAPPLDTMEYPNFVHLLAFLAPETSLFDTCSPIFASRCAYHEDWFSSNMAYVHLEQRSHAQFQSRHPGR
jgi:hypothetical protein